MDIEPIEYEKSIVIVPDIQYYTNTSERFHYINSIVDFCNIKKNEISVCLQTGDVTNNNLDWQWENAYQQFFSKLPKEISTIYCLGNHDYGKNGKSGTRDSNIPEKMRLSGDISMSGSKYDNYVKFVEINEIRYAILSLEFAPRNEVLDWANEVICEYSETPFIILTHAFLNKQGKLFDYNDAQCDNSDSQKSYSMGKTYLNDSREIFDKIIYNNKNVKIVICGHSLHSDFIAVNYVQNVVGKSIPCIMVNYQHDYDGGRGNIGVLAIKGNTFSLYSYSTVEIKFTKYFTSFSLENSLLN